MSHRHHRHPFHRPPGGITCALGITALVGFGGCATLMGAEQAHVVCAYDQTFDAALDAVKDHAITKQDRSTGQIQTGWLEFPMPDRKYGAFRRSTPDARDRSRLTIDLKAMNDVTQVSFTEEREAWTFRGGSRLFGWAPTDPSPEVHRDFQSRLTAKLKERGCHAS